MRIDSKNWNKKERLIINSVIEKYFNKLQTFHEDKHNLFLSNKVSFSTKEETFNEIDKKEKLFVSDIDNEVSILFDEVLKDYSNINAGAEKESVCKEIIYRIHKENSIKNHKTTLESKIEYLKKVKDDAKLILSFLKNRSFEIKDKVTQSTIIDNKYSLLYQDSIFLNQNLEQSVKALRLVVDDYLLYSGDVKNETINHSGKFLSEQFCLETIEKILKQGLLESSQIDITHISSEDAKAIVTKNLENIDLLPQDLVNMELILSVIPQVGWKCTLGAYNDDMELVLTNKIVFQEDKVNQYLQNIISKLPLSDFEIAQLAKKNVMWINEIIFEKWKSEASDNFNETLSTIIFEALKQNKEPQKLPFFENYRKEIFTIISNWNVDSLLYQIKKTDPKSVEFETKPHLEDNDHYIKIKNQYSDFKLTNFTGGGKRYLQTFDMLIQENFCERLESTFANLIKKNEEFVKLCPLNVLKHNVFVSSLKKIDMKNYLHLTKDLRLFWKAFQDKLTSFDHRSSRNQAILANPFLLHLICPDVEGEKKLIEEDSQLKEIEIIVEKIIENANVFMESNSIKKISELLNDLLLFIKNYQFCSENCEESQLSRYSKIYDRVLRLYLVIDGNALEYATFEHKNNPEIVKIATETNPEAIKFASYDIKTGATKESFDLIKKLLEISPAIVVRYLIPTSSNKEIFNKAKEAIRQNKTNLTKSVVTIINDGIDEMTQSLLQTSQFNQKSISQSSIQKSMFSKLKTEEEKECFAKEYQEYLKLVTDDPKNYFKLPELMQIDNTILNHVLREDPTIFNDRNIDTGLLKRIFSNLNLLRYTSDNIELWENFDFLKLVLRYNGMAYQFVQGTAKHNLQLATLALKNCYRVYDILDDELKNETQIKTWYKELHDALIDSFSNSRYVNLENLPKAILKEETIIELALSQNPSNILHIPKTLKNFENYAKAVLYGVSLSDVQDLDEKSHKLKDKYQIIQPVLKVYPEAIKFFNSEMKNYLPFLLMAMNSDPFVIKFVDKKFLKQNPGVIHQAVRLNHKVYDTLDEDLKSININNPIKSLSN